MITDSLAYIPTDLQGDVSFEFIREDSASYHVRLPDGSVAEVPKMPGSCHVAHCASTALRPEERLLNAAHFNWLAVLAAGVPALVTSPVLLLWGLRLRERIDTLAGPEETRSRRLVDLALVQVAIAWLLSQALVGLLLLHI